MKSLFSLSLIAVLLVGCAKLETREVIPSAYRFELGTVVAQLDMTQPLPVEINGSIVAGGLMQRANRGLFNQHLATLDIILLETHAADITQEDADGKRWSFDFEYDERAYVEHELRMKTQLRVHYQDRTILDEVYTCVAQGPQRGQYIDELASRIRHLTLAEDRARDRVWVDLRERCFDEIVEKFTTDVAIAR